MAAKRTHYMPIRLRTDERDVIIAAAQAAGLETAAFLRGTALREARLILAEQAAVAQRPAVRIA